MDLDLALDPDSDADSDLGIFVTKRQEKLYFEKCFLLFFSHLCFYTLIEDFQAQVKTIRPSAIWSMIFLT